MLTGNAVAEIVSLILLPLFFWLDIRWILEQPLSSLFFNWKTMQIHLRDPRVKSICIDLAVFGCVCSKQLALKGVWAGLQMLKAIETALKAILPSEYLELEKATQQSGRLGRVPVGIPTKRGMIYMYCYTPNYCNYFSVIYIKEFLFMT